MVCKTCYRAGTRVRVAAGSGLDSGKTGRIVRPSEVKTDGRGIPTNVQGAYKPVDWKREVAIRLDDGTLITMFKVSVHSLAEDARMSRYAEAFEHEELSMMREAKEQQFVPKSAYEPLFCNDCKRRIGFSRPRSEGSVVRIALCMPCYNKRYGQTY